MLTPRFVTLTSLVLLAVASRLVPHPWNLTSVSAVALFGGAYFQDRRAAFAVPLTALLISDLVLGLYHGMAGVYLSFAMIVGIGLCLRAQRRPALVILASLASSSMFFGVTNFGVWASGTLYPMTRSGLLDCYVAGLPFLRNAILGDLFYTLILFGGFALMERSFIVLRASPLPNPVAGLT